MPGREPSRVDWLRGRAAEHVRANTLRGAARDIGMTAPGLQAFLDGTTPHPKTRRKLETWLVRMEAESGGDTGLESATAALRVLLRDLPPSREAAGVSKAVDFLDALYEAERTPRPVWLSELRARLETGSE